MNQGGVSSTVVITAFRSGDWCTYQEKRSDRCARGWLKPPYWGISLMTYVAQIRYDHMRSVAPDTYRPTDPARDRLTKTMTITSGSSTCMYQGTAAIAAPFVPWKNASVTYNKPAQNNPIELMIASSSPRIFFRW